MTAMPARVVAPATVWGRELAGPGALPGWVVDGFAVLTHLGDVWLLVALAALTYLACGRRTGGFVAGTLLVGLAVTYLLKAWFAFPRPPAELRHVAVTGYGFPSGHAAGATVAWGALAVALDRVGTARQRAAVAGGAVVAVALSRVVLGVHYVGDVVAGIAIGLVVLGGAARWARDAPLPLFALAAAIALGGVAIPEGGWELAALAGAGIGALAAWQVVVPADRWRGRTGVVAAVGVAAVAAVALAVTAPVAALAFGAAGLATAAGLAGPAVSDRWRDDPAADGWTRD